MRQGNFLFISDSFFEKHDPDKLLMKNKEGAHDRPCFFAFPDKKEPDILWCIPISSRVEKFEKVAQQKVARQIRKGVQKPECNTIRFGEVLGQKRAFLIQNMFPVTATYIATIYIDKNTHRPVTIDPVTEKDIRKNARDILKLVFRGYSKLVFSDILKTYSDLIAELHATPPQHDPEKIQAAAGGLLQNHQPQNELNDLEL